MPASPFVPLIRAASLGPTARWIIDRGLPLEARLGAAGLGPQALDDPDTPIPLLFAARLIRDLARTEGPDVAMRIAEDVRDLGLLGAVALSAGTPRQAIATLSGFLPRLDTHETITFESRPNRVRIRGGWSIAFDPETRHIIEQYTAAQFHALCAATGAVGPLVEGLVIAPHPVHGVSHLQRWFGSRVAAARENGLVIDIPDRVADQPFALPASMAQLPVPPPVWDVLRHQGGFAWSARQALRMMVGAGPLSLDRLAGATGISRRSVQRRLIEAGSSFGDLSDSVLCEAALAALRSGDEPFGDISSRLGFANGSAFTRAVRRWAGASPRDVRSRAKGESPGP